MIVKDDSVGELEWVISVDSSVDSSVVRAPPARRRGPEKRGMPPLGSTPSPSTGKDSDAPRAG
ncbi:hypothetical protein [Saccharothrix coeruleofusca]|uniref:Uncharacterized protein n=1 Tax=Saccharothrix coeruleofusca TaxID=33919 RepID=A0A918EE23_9PSEU|nr:hypothetical protein GCM10010185_26350 [Saccharothrix coeruleofusca]